MWDLFIVLGLLFSSRSPKIKLFPTKSRFGWFSFPWASFRIFCFDTAAMCVFVCVNSNAIESRLHFCLPGTFPQLHRFKQLFWSTIQNPVYPFSRKKRAACCLGGLVFWESWIMFSQNFHSQLPCIHGKGNLKEVCSIYFASPVNKMAKLPTR